VDSIAGSSRSGGIEKAQICPWMRFGRLEGVQQPWKATGRSAGKFGASGKKVASEEFSE